MMRALPLLAATLFCSCTTYKTNFDCPPGVGVGCKSVSEIEAMIVENPHGPDSFIVGDKLGKSDCKGCTSSPKSFPRLATSKTVTGKLMVKVPAQTRRIWIVEKTSPMGNTQEGHYVTFTMPEDERWIAVDRPDDLKKIVKAWEKSEKAFEEQLAESTSHRGGDI